MQTASLKPRKAIQEGQKLGTANFKDEIKSGSILWERITGKIIEYFKCVIRKEIKFWRIWREYSMRNWS